MKKVWQLVAGGWSCRPVGDNSLTRLRRKERGSTKKKTGRSFGLEKNGWS